MCGITGIFAFNLIGKFNKVHVTAATMALEKRGPDFQDLYIDEWIGLGHRRLSIIDTTEAGNQPMWDETQRYCIVFNGEIFNYVELRDDLTARGHRFRTTSDTEVLLAAYVQKGLDCLQDFNGDFAFALDDRRNRTFVLARDRMGNENARAFDEAVRDLVTPHAADGVLDLAASAEVAWGDLR